MSTVGCAIEEFTITITITITTTTTVNTPNRNINMLADLIREAPLGKLIRLASGNKLLQYPEERDDFQLPEPWLILLNNPDAIVEEDGQTNVTNNNTVVASSASSITAEEDEQEDNNPEIKPSKNELEGDDEKPRPARRTSSGVGDAIRLHRTRSAEDTPPFSSSRLQAEDQHELEKTQSIPVVPKRTKDGAILVDWYYSDDAANPHNWTNNRRLGVALIICLYTFVVYTSSAIYTSSTEGVMAKFHVSQLKATLGLSLYVLGYGVGPLIFSPLSEIPRIGRNPVYIVTMFLFVIISIPTALVNNYPGLMVLRFLQGFFGSPCLASGGASLGDMYSLMALPYAMMAWVSAAYCGRECFTLAPYP